MILPPKAPVVGLPISTTSYDEVVAAIEDRAQDKALRIVVCNVHSVMSARRDPLLATALNTADIATPDGVPLVWSLRRTIRPEQGRVYGPDLMRSTLSDEKGRDFKHYLYGSTSETLQLLTESIGNFAPDAAVVGTFSPPFRAASPEDDAADAARILASGADIVWVGLGMPKQELWMYRMSSLLPGVALVGVGAAFDFLAGTVKEAPQWMMRAGLEWLYRLSQEPRRLWRRYLWNNPAFAVLAIRQLVIQRFRSAPTPKIASKN